MLEAYSFNTIDTLSLYSNLYVTALIPDAIRKDNENCENSQKLTNDLLYSIYVKCNSFKTEHKESRE